ncbi:hypothetical protein TIFTF001_000734 [Ficus carica]|uniref:Uncharacterized protein n=1 Tax=Ficus carica TaxID=3494 RepID=A0AA88CKJ5_FICCA|nr:hypothetical protein TIFTF001_000734 [Ficus carica]
MSHVQCMSLSLTQTYFFAELESLHSTSSIPATSLTFHHHHNNAVSLTNPLIFDDSPEDKAIAVDNRIDELYDDVLLEEPLRTTTSSSRTPLRTMMSSIVLTRIAPLDGPPP